MLSLLCVVSCSSERKALISVWNCVQKSFRLLQGIKPDQGVPSTWYWGSVEADAMTEWMFRADSLSEIKRLDHICTEINCSEQATLALVSQLRDTLIDLDNKMWNIKVQYLPSNQSKAPSNQGPSDLPSNKLITIKELEEFIVAVDYWTMQLYNTI